MPAQAACDRPLRLDFQGVTFVDRAGALLLRELVGERIRIVNCPALVRESLEALRALGQ